MMDDSSSTLNVRSVDGSIIKIEIAPRMTSDDLSHCIYQAALTPSREEAHIEPWMKNTVFESQWSQIAGLFRDNDNVFVPLSIILYDTMKYESIVFRVSRFPIEVLSVSCTKDDDQLFAGWSYRRILLIKILLAFLGWYYVGFDLQFENNFNILTESIKWFCTEVKKLPTYVIYTFVDHPLQELYRYGPTVIGIGWEGERLPKICNRITHMGDEAFWTRNIEECEEIYKSKEAAAMQIRRPILYFLIMYIIFIIIQSLIRTWAIHDRSRPDNSDMVEVYRAFHIIMSQIRRGLTAPPDARIQVENR